MTGVYNDYVVNGRLDAKELLPALLEDWRHNQDAIVQLMCKFGLIVKLPGDVYLVPSLLSEANISSGHEREQKRMLFFVSRQPMLKVNGSFVDKGVANDIGYVQSGFFNRGLFHLIQASNIKSTADLDFAEGFARLKRGHIIYCIRIHCFHVI